MSARNNLRGEIDEMVKITPHYSITTGLSYVTDYE